MALRGLRAVRLRPVTQCGPGQGRGFAVADFARQAPRIASGVQEGVMRVGALDRWRDMLDVRDVARGFAARE
jgi:GDP-4-dehydro-6-deoxy-D-mannose reductase